jgi:putative sterol carrier protein
MAGYTDTELFAKVVQTWINKLAADEDIAKRCKGIKCNMAFEIFDPDLNFYIDFQDGEVSGGAGESPTSMVFLEMSSETLDGMMTGEIDGASAAMSGEMSFSGDMGAAMGLQALSDDMGRLYLEAKKALGVS